MEMSKNDRNAYLGLLAFAKMFSVVTYRVHCQRHSTWSALYILFVMTVIIIIISGKHH